MDISVPAAFNVCERLLDENVKQGRGGKVAVICGDRQLTYAELSDNAARFAGALAGLGVEAEQRVLIVLPDSVEFVVAFLGCIRLGAVAVPVNTLLTRADYEYLLDDSRARVLVVHTSLLEQVPTASAWLRHTIVTGGAAPPGAQEWERALARGEPRPPAQTTADEPAFWLYSSGTTGSPKGVVHLQQDVLFSLCYGQGVLGVDERCRMLASSKLFFAYALGCALHIPFLVGGTTILCSERATPAAIAELARRHRPSHFFSVPTFYAGALHAGQAGSAYESLECCVSAGEALPAALYDAWLKDSGKEIVEHIGSTEHIYAFISNRPGRVRPGSAGVVVPGIEARLVDDEGRDVAPGGHGQLLIKSGSNAIGYSNKRAQTKATFRGEWLWTGDVMSQDEDGFYWYHGRVNDMLKVSGIWVSPIEVEQTLQQHPGVLESAVIGAPDGDGLIKPKAFVVRGQPNIGAAELQEFVKSRLAPYKYPRWIEFVDELPRTATGKIQRFQLRR